MEPELGHNRRAVGKNQVCQGKQDMQLGIHLRSSSQQARRKRECATENVVPAERGNPCSLFTPPSTPHRPLKHGSGPNRTIGTACAAAAIPVYCLLFTVHCFLYNSPLSARPNTYRSQNEILRFFQHDGVALPVALSEAKDLNTCCLI